MSNAMAEDDSESFETLLGSLDATAKRRQEQDTIRQYKGPRIPYVHDLDELEWKPLPKLDQVRHTLKAGASRRFVTHTRQSGQELSRTEYSKPKVLSIWHQDRVVQPSRNYMYPADHKGYRFHAHSHPFQEPTDDLCEKRHRDWLAKHREHRHNHEFPLHHALQMVDKAKAAHRVTNERRENTRDIMGRLPRPGENHTGPRLTQNMKTGLDKVLKGVKAIRSFNKLKGIDVLREEEDEAYKKVVKAESAPILQFHEKPPAGRATHLRSFAPHNVSLRDLRTSTPWLHEDEVRELKRLGRKTM
jgi:hypothetical protein